MSESTVKAWLNAIIASARDHKAHMSLISSRINLVGVPGFESLGFDDGSNQCKHDFDDGMIAEIKYQGLNVRAATDERIMFVTRETIDGSRNPQGIECLLEKEQDQQWRQVQQRILAEDETAQYLDKS